MSEPNLKQAWSEGTTEQKNVEDTTLLWRVPLNSIIIGIQSEGQVPPSMVYINPDLKKIIENLPDEFDPKDLFPEDGTEPKWELLPDKFVPDNIDPGFIKTIPEGTWPPDKGFITIPDDDPEVRIPEWNMPPFNGEDPTTPPLTSIDPTPTDPSLIPGIKLPDFIPKINTVPYEDVKENIVGIAVRDSLARDAINSVGHEMDVDKFQDYVREREAYEAFKELADKMGIPYEGEAPTAPKGYEGIYEEAYADYKQREEVLDAYLESRGSDDPVPISGDNPYADMFDEIGAKYEATEKALDEVAGVASSLPPIPGLGLASEMGKYPEWGDVLDAIGTYTKNLPGLINRIDTSEQTIDPERRAEIEQRVGYEGFTPVIPDPPVVEKEPLVLALDDPNSIEAVKGIVMEGLKDKYSTGLAEKYNSEHLGVTIDPEGLRAYADVMSKYDEIAKMDEFADKGDAVESMRQEELKSLFDISGCNPNVPSKYPENLDEVMAAYAQVYDTYSDACHKADLVLQGDAAWSPEPAWVKSAKYDITEMTGDVNDLLGAIDGPVDGGSMLGDPADAMGVTQWGNAYNGLVEYMRKNDVSLDCSAIELTEEQIKAIDAGIGEGPWDVPDKFSPDVGGKEWHVQPIAETIENIREGRTGVFENPEVTIYEDTDEKGKEQKSFKDLIKDGIESVKEKFTAATLTGAAAATATHGLTQEQKLALAKQELNLPTEDTSKTAEDTFQAN